MVCQPGKLTGSLNEMVEKYGDIMPYHLPWPIVNVYDYRLGSDAATNTQVRG